MSSCLCGSFFRWTQSLAERLVADVLWEFVGAEAALREILRGERPYFRLEHVNREQADGSVAYLNFQVTPLDEDRPGQGLLLLVEDETGYGRLQQDLVQDRNELRLVRQRLLRQHIQPLMLQKMQDYIPRRRRSRRDYHFWLSKLIPSSNPILPVLDSLARFVIHINGF